MCGQYESEEFRNLRKEFMTALKCCGFTEEMPLLSKIKERYHIQPNQSMSNFITNFDGNEIDVLLVSYYYLYEEWKNKTDEGLV